MTLATLRSYLVPVLAALLLHAGVLMLAAGNMFDKPHQPRQIEFRSIKAELVDLKSTQIAKQQEQEALRQQQQEQQRKAEAQREQQALERKKAEQTAQRKAEQQRKAAEQRQAEERKKAEAKRVAEAKRKQAEAEKAKQLALEKERKLAEQKRKAAEEKRKQEELARKKAEAERQKREAEAARKRQQQLEQQRREQELARAAAREAEAKRNAQLDQAARTSASDIIYAAVSSNWRRPASARNGMEVLVRIRLLPTGEVDDAYVVESSGDDAFDRSAVNAVLKAAKFPELQQIDPVVFDRNLRNIILTFRPEDLRL